MSQFISEIRLFAFPFAPRGWAKCDGAIYSVSNNITLFMMLGYKFGGSGDNFSLPDLRGRVMIANGSPLRPDFLRAGAEKHVLTIKEMPAHNHSAVASSNGVDTFEPLGHFWASNVGYVKDSNNLMHPNTIKEEGGDLAHNNMSPYLPLNYCIAVTGEHPDGSYREVNEFTGAIRPFGRGVDEGVWLKCDGRELPLSQFIDLFKVLGYTYGGVENRTFRLPDLRGRALVSCGTPPGLSAYKLGEKAGEPSVKLTKEQIPTHNHKALVNPLCNSQQPNNCGWAVNSNTRPSSNSYAKEKGNGSVMGAGAIGITGNDEAHSNMMPYQAMEFMICSRGDDPTIG
ncbi:microcystin-dependent protein [Dyadobacter sp. BE34]|uniref:Microcystin-dependent protein n=1 Tax=Dyadobacter fermentans TaxID=94254 RepID=A0ABU1R7M6_9BACT|nr:MULTISPECIES: tail fiber protein [Dyadobacter]MDR6808600.1 microcystin-dependent protein [Dyadobacter fermentans]MDR7046343.1 microcystin-dependent protein [Dyadobacter sp. BE242]MDR7200656.1 microcystin-dependent protein [Dyadobacter sp. BE34]MDR7218616.1 microcystin-dependent protein [Dyadobacter sp. BE31]MDR7266546.1 microcystin-dependent protein [Dyadobacter sp. BE32]